MIKNLGSSIPYPSPVGIRVPQAPLFQKAEKGVERGGGGGA